MTTERIGGPSWISLRALTVCQPFAHLIALPDSDDRMKRVENRTWHTPHRGELLIHAGRSRKWLDLGTVPDPKCDACRGTGFVDVETGRSIVPGVGWGGMNMAAECGCEVEADETYGIPIDAMAFGAVVATCRLIDCFPLVGPNGEWGWARGEIPTAVRMRHPWIAGHVHVEGPWCWVLSDVVRLREPIPWKGAQGLWNVPRELADRVRELTGDPAVAKGGTS